MCLKCNSIKREIGTAFLKHNIIIENIVGHIASNYFFICSVIDYDGLLTLQTVSQSLSSHFDGVCIFVCVFLDTVFVWLSCVCEARLVTSVGISRSARVVTAISVT